MALPVAPLAGLALRYGAVAVATYAATRAIPKLRRDQNTEDVLDTVEEGMELRRDAEQISGTGRFRRVVRFGSNEPGIEIDATALTRIRIKKV
ncbi:MAG: hypothetical protein AAF386_06400 [Pseudomonadota bacterium]